MGLFQPDAVFAAAPPLRPDAFHFRFLVLAASAVLLSLPSADSLHASAAQTVPADWEHIPDGAVPGDSFRLLVVTSATRDASSSDIFDYNGFVQSADETLCRWPRATATNADAIARPLVDFSTSRRSACRWRS